MPIPAHPHVKPRPRGFTLMELMVVLVLIGIITSMGVISLGGGQDDSLEEEARRITVLMQLASEEAVLSARPLGVQFERTGYRFLRYQEDAWQVIEDDHQLRPREVPDFVRLQLLVEGLEQEVDEEEDEELRPDIMLLETGEQTPFELVVRADDVQGYYQITGEINGTLDFRSTR